MQPQAANNLAVETQPARPASPVPPPLPDVPAPAPARIESIDVLRGFALLGILVVNVQSFAMIEAAYFTPTAYGDLSGVNFWVWALTHVLADQKMMSIFAMLFGAGIVLMASSRERTGRSPGAAHYRRMAVLLVFGMVHAYCLWYGDILVSYALCGMAAYLLRRAPPKVLVPLGVVLLAIPSVVLLLGAASLPYWPADAVAEFNADAVPPPAVVTEELATYRGGWLRQMSHRAPTSLFFQTVIFAAWGFWRVLGLMCLGMALLRLGVFSAARPTRFYVLLALTGFAVGVPVAAWGAYLNFAEDWRPTYAYFVGTQFNYWASVATALGWVSLVMLVCKAGPRAAALTGPLSAVGRLALTNYLLQTLVCTTIFYGHGLGLFGRVQRIGQLGIVAGVWALQLALSPLYLKHFRIGPAEWLWRCLTDLKVLPLRRTEPLPAPVAAGPAAP